MPQFKKEPWVVRSVEERFGKKVPWADEVPPDKTAPGLDNLVVAVLGGGMAGSAFTRHFLCLTARNGSKARVVMINAINCNYCGGLVTRLAQAALTGHYQLSVPEDRILSRIDDCIYLNPAGDVRVKMRSPLASILRTSRFGELGFDDSFKERITEGLPAGATDRFQMIEPARVLRVVAPRDGRRGRVVFMRYAIAGQPLAEEVEADVIVLATGLRSVGMKMLDQFAAETGFVLPTLMKASVTEIDAHEATYNRLGNSVLMIDGIIPGCIAALIPKRPDWLTLTSLNKVLTPDDITRIFSHPAVRKYINLPRAASQLRCKRICSASVFTHGSPNFYGDSWVVIGDLTGYGRVLKDGYLAALRGAHLAAETIVYYGWRRQDFARHYHGPLKGLRLDNSAGMGLFRLNLRLSRFSWFNRLIISAGNHEGAVCSHGGPVHAAIRAITTGELSYRWIWGLFVLGILRYVFLGAPAAAWRRLLGRGDHKAPAD